MKLYNYFRSSAAYRARIALNVKGLQYEYVSKALLKNEHRSAEYLTLNPEGLIPALEVDGAVITQSLAIIEYLEELQPEPRLLPADPLARAHVRSLALAIACDIHPLNNLRVLNYLRRELGQNDDGVNAWYRHWIGEGLGALERQVAKYSSSRRYCFGDSLSLADVCLVPQMYNARRFKCDVAPYPVLVAISTHLETLPAFVAARPEVQPDAQ